MNQLKDDSLLWMGLGSSVLVLTQPSTISFKVVAPALWHWEPLSFKLLSLVINLTPLRWETSTTNGSTTATLVVPANTPISLSEQLLKEIGRASCRERVCQ